ncbi:MAG: Gfo/Idh/MocA family oxidoreductase [Planctomycetaceae bacterium]|nr:Gfo/Idh/MocA family oxidoreductase [Planctomycetaceae bacterium]
MAKEKAVVVGAGGISGAWFPPLKAEKINIVGIVDLDVERAKKRLADYQLECPVGTDLADMLKKTRPDFVVDLTIPEAHCAVTCTALKAGCHVIGEKPMASSMAEARKMCATAKATKKMYMVSQSRRWQGNETRVRKTLQKNRIGTLTTFNCDFYIGAHFGGFRDAMDSPLILDMAIHQFDLARYMTGTDPVAVYAKEFNPKGSWYKGDVSAMAIFEMTNGVMFCYRGSWCSEGCHTSWNGDWRFIGDKGTLLYHHDQVPTGQVIQNKEGFFRQLKDITADEAPMKFGGMHGALREMLAFIRTGKKPQTACDDNIKSLAMVHGVIESSKTGKRVKL